MRQCRGCGVPQPAAPTTGWRARLHLRLGAGRIARGKMWPEPTARQPLIAAAASPRQEVQVTTQQAPAPAAPAAEISPPRTGDTSCVSVGMDVECRVVEGSQRDAAALPTAPTSPQAASAWTSAATLALLVSPFAFWGTSMVVMKGLPLPPLIMGSVRLLPAGMLLVAWAAAQGRPQPSTLRAWLWIAAFGLVDGAAFQGFLAEGLQNTPAGLGSVIIDSQPLTVAILASLLFGEQLGAAGVAGLLLGVAGLLLLELPEQYLHTAVDGLHSLPAMGGGAMDALGGDLPDSITAGLPSGAGLPELNARDLIQVSAPPLWAASGEFWMLAAAQSMAVGTVMVRYVTRHADPVMATGWHMVFGGVLLLGAATAGNPTALPTSLAVLGDAQHLAEAGYVSLLGGAASYGIFFWQASKPGNLTKLSSLTFLTPVFAAVTAYFVLGEVLTTPQLLGAGVTLVAVYLITRTKGGPPPPKSKPTLGRTFDQ